MSENTQMQPAATQPLKIERASDYHVLFANHLKLRVGPGEFSIVFGFVEDQEGVPVAEEKVQIAFSPQTARLISVALQAALTSYEEQYGLIGQLRAKPINSERVYQAIAGAVEPLTR